MIFMKKDELCHYGVLGMHWGVRRYQSYDVKPRKSGKRGKEIGKLSSNSDFDDEVSDIRNSLSNKPQPFEKSTTRFNYVKRRGGLTDSEAVECIEVANKIFSKAERHEKRITKDVIDSATNANNCNMYGLEYRMKQPESIAAKIGSDAKIKNISFDKAGTQLNDILRYTAVSDKDSFVSNYGKIVDDLESKGYREIKCKNYYDLYSQGRVMHKALQSVFKDNKTGLTFELQYHTPESQAAKELKVPLYEESRSVKTSIDRLKELEIEMVNLAEKVPNPRGINTIKNK